MHSTASSGHPACQVAGLLHTLNKHAGSATLMHFSRTAIGDLTNLFKSSLARKYEMAAAESSQFWSFDVSSLMILVGEAEEQKYRLAGRLFLESLVAAPVSGL